jgi:pimeloyl-ACP methyl ester carboxylesterase
MSIFLSTLKYIVIFILGIAFILLMGLASLMRPDIPVDRLKETYANDASDFVHIDGMDIHYRDEGHGPAILLLHGTFSSLHTWDVWTTELTENFRVVRLDLPGFGLTGPHPDNDYSNKATMFLLESLRQHLEISSWSVAGNSLGGRIALDYARHFPLQTNNIILLNPAYSLPSASVSTNDSDQNSQPNEHSTSDETSGDISPEKTTGASETVSQQVNESNQRPLVSNSLKSPAMLNLLSVLTPRSFIHFALKEVYADEERIQTETLQRYFELLRREGNRKTYLTRNDPPSGDRSHLPDLPAPINTSEIQSRVLILWGEQDRWIPVRWAPIFKNSLQNAELIIYPDAGHVPMEEIPLETATDAKYFLLNNYSN